MGKANTRRQAVLLFTEKSHLVPQVRGSKGHGLALMHSLGLPVPPGFTVSTTVARAFAQHQRLPQRLSGQLERGVAALEGSTGKKLGDPANPLLVSVRSGAQMSMPGMMDTVLNLGLNWEIVRALAKRDQNRRFALDLYRRFLALYAQVVLGMDRRGFQQIENTARLGRNRELPNYIVQGICTDFRGLIAEAGHQIPDDPRQQLESAMLAVLNSWNSPRARTYRSDENIPDWWGTAVNVQAMVYGNRGPNSATGVAFSHNLSTGDQEFNGEFLINAQGEDVVGGSHTPLSIAAMRTWSPALYTELKDYVQRLAAHFNDAVDVEFTVEEGRLWILQSRVAKRSAEAAAVTAVRKVWSKAISREQAVNLFTVRQLKSLARNTATIDQTAVADHVSVTGLAASPGVATGKAVFDCEKAVALAAKNVPVVLIRPDTTPDDLGGMRAAKAIVTRRGGITCHAAVTARGLGVPAVVGVESIDWSPDRVVFRETRTPITDGDVVTVDGTSGVVVVGEVPLAVNALRRKEVDLLLRWADLLRPADTLPEPRLDFSTCDRTLSANTYLNDFYLSDAMALRAKGTVLEREAWQVKRDVGVRVAETFATYLLIAVGREARHASSRDMLAVSPEYRALQQDRFGVLSGSDEPVLASKVIIRTMRGAGRDQHIEFFRLAEALFTYPGWPEAYGGKRWAAIAQAGLHFLQGKTTHSVFVDHVFDLKHNGGKLFNKHAMLNSTEDYRMQAQLEVKKYARTLPELHRELLKLRSEISPAVQRLWKKGDLIGLWAAAS